MQILFPLLASSPAGMKLMCADLIAVMLFVRKQGLALYIFWAVRGSIYARVMNLIRAGGGAGTRDETNVPPPAVGAAAKIHGSDISRGPLGPPSASPSPKKNPSLLLSDSLPGLVVSVANNKLAPA